MKKETMRYCIWLRTISSLLAGAEFTGTWSLLGKQVPLPPPQIPVLFGGNGYLFCFITDQWFTGNQQLM